MSNTESGDLLFKPTSLVGQTVRNRIVRSATNDHLSWFNGEISDEEMHMFAELAEGGSGIIITGHYAASERYRTSPNQPLLCNDSYIDGAARVADAIHGGGALAIAQISNGGNKGCYHKLDINTASVNELVQAEQELVDAAVRAEAAGYDGVEVHLAHGYFLASVLDVSLNHRSDEYGVTDEGRFRLVGNVLQRIRTCVRSDFQLWVKISATNKEGTNNDEHLLAYARLCKQCGVDVIEVSGSDFAKRPRNDEAYYLREALLIKHEVGLPTVLVGGLYTRTVMEKVLDEGIDFVSLSRALICEPDLPNLMRQGREESHCIRCNGCFRLFDKKWKRCIFGAESPQLRELYPAGE